MSNSRWRAPLAGLLTGIVLTVGGGLSLHGVARAESPINIVGDVTAAVTGPVTVDAGGDVALTITPASPDVSIELPGAGSVDAAVSTDDGVQAAADVNL